jgi:hypothetical protein
VINSHLLYRLSYRGTVADICGQGCIFNTSLALLSSLYKATPIKNAENPHGLQVARLLVELIGIEPTAYALRTHRSPS